MNDELAALIALHSGQERQGPGDPEISREILSALPTFRELPRIADLGCGSGAGALVLAEWFNVPLKAVDLSRAFLDQLEERAELLGLSHLIQTIEADMGNLNWPDASVDLIWSEGAAYHLTFKGALQAWRRLLPSEGLAVVSELNWFSDNPAAEARAFWKTAYPTMGDEAENVGHAAQAGFEVLSTRRLPAEAWWSFYYGPLRARIEDLRLEAAPAMLRVIQETEMEMDLFRSYSADYGYTYYVLRAA